MLMAMSRSEIAVVIIMRFMGVFALLAIFAVFFPYSWMNACHEYMGLGTLPDEPIVSYLARSLSAFYAVQGVIALCISSDIRRYRPLVTMWAVLVTSIGALMTWIDLVSGMPPSWTWSEGPPTIIVGLAVLWLQRRIRQPDADALTQ
jgi:hypothetical protein